MCYRNSLEETHKLYYPIHRGRNFKHEERKLAKYLNCENWYKDHKYGDEFKDVWKNNIKRKGRKRGKINRNIKKRIDAQGEHEVTVAMFVPPMPNGQLLNMLKVAEKTLETDVNWRCKLLEKPGRPLLLNFIRKTPILQGCPSMKDCKLCVNKAIKCARKNVVYKAECMLCKEQIKTLKEESCQDEKLLEFYNNGTYIGETSRVIRLMM